MAKREGENGEHQQPFDDERELGIHVEGRSSKRREHNAGRQAARRRRQGDTGSEPSVLGTDAAPETSDTPPVSVPDAVPEADHDAPTDVPPGDPAVPEEKRTGETDVPAGVSDATAGAETAAVVSDGSVAQEVHAEETDAQREKRENQEACRHFHVGQQIRASIRGGFLDGWKVETVNAEHGYARITNGKVHRDVMAKLLLSWQPGDFTQQGAGAADIPPSAPEGAGDTGDTPDSDHGDAEAERRKQQYRSALEDLNAFYEKLLAMDEQQFLSFASQLEEDYTSGSSDLALSEYEQLDGVMTKAREQRAGTKGNDGGQGDASGEHDDGDAGNEDEKRAVDMFEVGDEVKVLWRNSPDAGWIVESIDREGNIIVTKKDFVGPAGSVTERMPVPAETLLEWQKLDVADNGEDPNDPERMTDDELARLQSDNLYERLGLQQNATTQDIESAFRSLRKRFLRRVRHHEFNQNAFANLNEAYRTLSNSRWRANYDAAQAGRANTGGGPRGPENVPPNPDLSPERKKNLDLLVNETRAAYAKALRTKVHAFIGVKKDEEVNRLHDEYVQAMDARLQHTIDMVKRGFGGKDLADPDVQKRLGDRLIVVTQAGRLREETAFRRDLREANEKKASRWIQKALAKSAKARLWTGLAMTGSAFVLGAVGRGELAAAIQMARTPLGVAGSVTMADAAWQLIESSHGAMKKRTQKEVDDMDDPDKIRKILAAHEWKYARFMTQEFGNRSEFHLPKFDRTAKLMIRRHEATYDETGKMLMARYDQLMREKIEQDIRAQLQATGGNVDQAVANRAKHYAVRQEELGSLHERGKKERRLAIGKILANTAAGIASALTFSRGHHGNKTVDGPKMDHPSYDSWRVEQAARHPGPGEYLGHRPGIPVDEVKYPEMGYPVDGHGTVPDITHVDTGAVQDTSTVAGHAQVPDASHAAGTPVPEVPGHAELYAGQGADATIRAKEGIEHALRRQLEHFDIAQQHGYTGPDDPHALHAWSGGEAHNIALNHSITDPATGAEYPIVDPKTGVEQWVHTPGTHVYLNPDGSVTVDHPSDLYTHAAYHPDTGHAAAHVPQPEGTVPEAAAPGSVLPLDTAPHDVLQQTIHDAYYPSDAGAPTDDILIGPDTYVPDLHHAGTGIADHAAHAPTPGERAPVGVHADATSHGGGDHGGDAGQSTAHTPEHGIDRSDVTQGYIETLTPETKRAIKAVFDVHSNDASLDDFNDQIHAVRLGDMVSEHSLWNQLKSSGVDFSHHASLERAGNAWWQFVEAMKHQGIYNPKATLGELWERAGYDSPGHLRSPLME